MIPFTVVMDFLSILYILSKVGGLEESQRILEGITDCVSARITDFEKRGKKRKREGEIPSWIIQGRELVQKARRVLGQGTEEGSEKKRKVEEGSIFSSQTRGKLTVVYKFIKTLSAFENQVDEKVLISTMSDQRGPDRGTLFPVRTLVGLGASNALKRLKDLLLSDTIGRIAILGMEGLGKTSLMKHLHNNAIKSVDRFDYAFWVSCPRPFNIKRLQDALAAAMKCKLCTHDDVNARAEALCNILKGLGTFVIFLDGVPEVKFSLHQIGISVPVEESKSKVVLTTRSASVSVMLDCSETVKLDCLSAEEACELLIDEARISMDSNDLISFATKFATMCEGVPGKIIDIGTRMRNIDDICEWKNALFELENNEG
ncbi:unnamed protein product [Amaranthus hypochondriacus]